MPAASRRPIPSNRPRRAKPLKKAAAGQTDSGRRAGKAARGKPARSHSEAAAGMSDQAVRRATGRGWDEWFNVLDARGAKKLPHADIATILHTELGVGPWWGQMVTVAYERFRGLRDKHQKPDGYSISASRTIDASPKAAFDAWTDPAQLARWLPGARITAHKSTPNKSVRLTWTDGAKSVHVMLYPKPGNRVQVTVQHDKLPAAPAVKKMKSFWKAALESLEEAIT